MHCWNAASREKSVRNLLSRYILYLTRMSAIDQIASICTKLLKAKQKPPNTSTGVIVQLQEACRQSMVASCSSLEQLSREHAKLLTAVSHRPPCSQVKPCKFGISL